MAARSEVEVLRAAIRQHRDAIKASRKHTYLDWVPVASKVDWELWAHVEETDG